MRGKLLKATIGAIIGGSVGDGFVVLLPANGFPDFLAAVAFWVCTIGGAWIGWSFRLKKPACQPPEIRNSD